ncbi:MAG: hypothetical protein H7Z41_18180 [Cytophagales bacterium]|nr:hypothetical protein [Armatimonadota bacterium]
MSAPLPILTPRRRSRLLLRIAAGLFGFLLMIGLVTLGIFTLTDTARSKGWAELARTLPEHKAAVRRQGIPLTAAQLKRSPPVPPDQNAAPIYLQIAAQYEQIPVAVRDVDNAALRAFNRPQRAKADRAAARKILLRDAEILRLAEKAVQRPGCDFARFWEQGNDARFPEFAAMRHVAHLLAARARFAIESGNPEAALKDIAAGMQVSNHVEQNPYLLDLLVGYAIEAIVDRPFLETLQQYGHRSDVLAGASSAETVSPRTPSLRHAVAGEAFFACNTFRLLRETPEGLPDEIEKTWLAPIAARHREDALDAWESRTLAFWCDADRELKAASGNLLAEHHGMKRVRERFAAQDLEPGYELTAAFTPTFDPFPAKTMQIAAYRVLRQQAVALLRHRLANGQFPDSLSDLPEKKRIADPFTNQRLRYRKTDTGFLLYSVGVNFTDDNGDDETIDRGNTLDLAFRYSR